MKYLALMLLLTACMSRTEKNSEPAGLIKPKSGQRNCLTKHTNEAILINEKRAKVYSELSGGKSKIISFSLISLEKLSLPIAAKYDNEAHYFHQRNIHVLCDDLVSLEDLPDTVELSDEVASMTYFEQDVRGVSAKLNTLNEAKDYDGLYTYTNGIVENLLEKNASNCLYKHFIESVRRSSWLMSQRKKSEADLQGKLEKFLQGYLSYQIKFLGTADRLDRKAVELHKQGIGILCLDLPYIPAQKS